MKAKDLLFRKIAHPDVVSGETFRIHGTLPEIWYTYETGILIYLKSGSLGFRTGQDLILLRCGQMIYFPPKAPRLLKEVGQQNLIGWRISIPVSSCKTLPNALQTVNASNLLVHLGERIVSWGESDLTQMPDERKRLIATFLDEMDSISAHEKVSLPFPKSASLAQVAKKMMENPHERKQVADWARAAGMSLRSFTTQFAKETGLSFSAWRQRIRLHVAVQGLSQKRGVTQIASELGYSSPSAFAEAFRKEFGVSPKQYSLRLGRE